MGWGRDNTHSVGWVDPSYRGNLVRGEIPGSPASEILARLTRGKALFERVLFREVNFAGSLPYISGLFQVDSEWLSRVFYGLLQ